MNKPTELRRAIERLKQRRWNFAREGSGIVSFEDYKYILEIFEQLEAVTKERDELLLGVNRLRALSISQNEWIEEALGTLKQCNLPITREPTNE